MGKACSKQKAVCIVAQRGRDVLGNGVAGTQGAWKEKWARGAGGLWGAQCAEGLATSALYETIPMGTTSLRESSLPGQLVLGRACTTAHRLPLPNPFPFYKISSFNP